MAEYSLQQQQALALASARRRRAEQSKPAEVGVGRTAFDQGMQGATFGFADEIQDRIGSGIASLYTGESYDDLLKEARGASQSRLQAEMQQNPGTAITANIGGALLTGGAGSTTKAGTALANSLRTGGLAARVGKSALAGAASGAVAGAGSAGEGGRLEGAGFGALLGGLAGGAIPAVGAGLKKGASSLINKFADNTARKIGKETGEIIVPQAPLEMRKVFDRLRADYPDDNEFLAALNSYAAKNGKTLVEAGQSRITNLAEGSAMYPSGGAKATEFFTERVGQAPEKIKTSVSKNVSPSTNFSDDVDSLLEAGRAKAAPLYKGAFKANEEVTSPLINKILSTPEGKASLQEAVKNIQNEMAKVAKPDKELTQLAKELSDIGLMNATRGGVAKGLKLRTLDEVKKAMDSTIKSAYRTGKSDQEIARFVSLKNALVSELDNVDKSGLYAKARSVSGDYLGSKSAMDDGLKFLVDDAENIPRRLSNFTSSQKEAYRAGVVKAIRNNIDNKIDGRNITEIFQRPATRNKLKAILTPKEYVGLLEEVRVNDNIFKLKNQITGNSRTQIRKIASEEFDNEGQQILGDLVQKGFARTTFEQGVKLIKRQFNGLNDKLSGDVADILYESDPKKKYKIVKELVNLANYSGESVRKTQAAQKLSAFYSLSDKISKIKTPAASVSGGASVGGLSHENKPLRLTIRPEQSLPKVDLPRQP